MNSKISLYRSTKFIDNNQIIPEKHFSDRLFFDRYFFELNLCHTITIETNNDEHELMLRSENSNSKIHVWCHKNLIGCWSADWYFHYHGPVQVKIRYYFENECDKIMFTLKWI